MTQGEQGKEDLQESEDVPAHQEEALAPKYKMASWDQPDPAVRGEAKVHLDKLGYLDNQESQEMMWDFKVMMIEQLNTLFSKHFLQISVLQLCWLFAYERAWSNFYFYLTFLFFQAVVNYDDLRAFIRQQVMKIFDGELTLGL